MASKAMDELRSATLSGKSLFVKLIPNIHVRITYCCRVYELSLVMSECSIVCEFISRTNVASEGSVVICTPKILVPAPPETVKQNSSQRKPFLKNSPLTPRRSAFRLEMSKYRFREQQHQHLLVFISWPV